jgi:hypothetical protein
LKKWPRRERQVTTIEALQRQIDRFVLYYNCDLTCRCAVAVESTRSVVSRKRRGAGAHETTAPKRPASLTTRSGRRARRRRSSRRDREESRTRRLARTATWSRRASRPRIGPRPRRPRVAPRTSRQPGRVTIRPTLKSPSLTRWTVIPRDSIVSSERVKFLARASAMVASSCRVSSAVNR